MSCTAPVSWQDLVLYWANDLSGDQSDAVEEHLMSCEACSAQSARVSAVVEGLRGLIPPVISRAAVNRIREQGKHLLEIECTPGSSPVVFPREADLLVLRLTGFDLAGAERVSVAIRVESTGALLVDDPLAAFDVDEGVLIACQRHFAELPPDFLFEVTAFDRSGAERTARYSIPHVFEV